ncbi:DUF1109 domain-containing protein [Paracoccus sp. MBLB3053]|uniref:DUF1109 domain-containing protein n=1 Tax=Paracoccus aurantius TaxID=3073814 RepID=A0ABU2HXC5_9RHOB|nr:DUF1109 domain-containing protein [Paracoccus sp. MBLB3053]MDS9468964.1 DUF1109 domain-containing protein [Paracoccus sp. MBLB3053]
MNTDDLIARLAAEPPRPSFQPQRIMLAVLGAVALACGLFLGVVGIRDDLFDAMSHPAVQAKTLLPFLICLVALPRAMRSARPEGNRLPFAALSWPIGAAIALGIWSWVTLPSSARLAEMTMPAIAECVGLILLLTSAPLGLAISRLRSGAPTRPRMTGALAGLGVSAAAATGYSLFCTQDNPVFFVIWYGAALLVATFAGAYAGAHWLRW